ncbi:MAG: PQQ-binding-like beta-propeller repeat protein [Gemmatimonadaceae bacterium]
MRASALLLAVLTACNSIVDGNAASMSVKRLWFTPFSSPGAWPGLPAIDGGLVLVAGVGGMAAYDAATGQPRWQAQIWTGGQASFAGNIVTLGGLACIADYFGVGCAELATGHVRWTAATDQPTQDGEAAIDANALYYGTAKHAVVARDLATGEILWTTDVNPGTAFLNPVFGVRLRGDTLFATTVRWQDRTGGTIVGDLVALARSDGRELWRYTAPSRSGFQGAPLLVDNLAILNDVYSHGLVAVDLTTHTVRWRTDVREDGYITAERPPILLGDTLYAGSTDTQVYAVDVHTGAYRWRVGTRAGSIGSTAVCGRLVLVVPFSGGPLNTVDRVRLVSDRPNVLDGDDLAGRIAVVGTTAYAAGTRGLYALSCPADGG